MKRTAPPKLDVFPAAKQRRLDALLEKNAEGALTAREARALKELVAEAETLMIANARRLSRFAASERGRGRRNAVPVTVWVQPDSSRR